MVGIVRGFGGAIVNTVKLLVSVLAWLSFFAAVWGILLGYLSGWYPFSAAVFFLFLGALTFIPAAKDKDDDPPSS